MDMKKWKFASLERIAMIKRSQVRAAIVIGVDKIQASDPLSRAFEKKEKKKLLARL